MRYLALCNRPVSRAIWRKAQANSPVSRMTRSGQQRGTGGHPAAHLEPVPVAVPRGGAVGRPVPRAGRGRQRRGGCRRRQRRLRVGRHGRGRADGDARRRSVRGECAEETTCGLSLLLNVLLWWGQFNVA